MMGHHVKFVPSFQDPSPIRTLHDASHAILSVSWCGQWLATGGDDNIVRVYNVAEDGPTQQVAEGWTQRYSRSILK